MLGSAPHHPPGLAIFLVRPHAGLAVQSDAGAPGWQRQWTKKTPHSTAPQLNAGAPGWQRQRTRKAHPTTRLVGRAVEYQRARLAPPASGWWGDGGERQRESDDGKKPCQKHEADVYHVSDGPTALRLPDAVWTAKFGRWDEWDT
ncbi:hypothetical protein FB45DRAFT_859216 [Roridomyces roridus]|uniref:Uncharacterized protein n=1 Tax=Roridomyces roridus TaxID=1738132 RepID=A0AAD7FYV7_9AGAR|nr:hypothetical protein FB45DRAFT_859216 [Roridomyces roridus]